MKSFKVKKISDLNPISKEILDLLPSKNIVLLIGELGAGKTTLVKKILKTYGLNEEEISSPTFNIVNTYEFLNQTIYHIDLYRIKNKNELIDTGVIDILESKNICFVEWPEILLNDKKEINIGSLYLNHTQFQMVKLEVISKRDRVINLC